tara:strand:- start:49 stop:1680 length:1632 start_codon:yes stop_codon:yes gene_type:complete
MSYSFVEKLAATQKRMYKKWINYSKSGNPTVFYRSKKNFGWNLKEMVPFFQKQQLIKCNMLKCSEDSEVRQIYEARCQKEYEASTSKTQIIRQIWRPTVEERTCAQAAAHKRRVKSQKAFASDTKTPKPKSDDCIRFHRGGVLEDTQKDADSHQAPADVDTKKEERADMLAEFEEQAESKRYMHCLKLAQFAEWREWDNVMAQDREWNKLIQSRDDTILSFQLGALEDTLPTPSIRKLWYGTKVDANCKVCQSGQQCSLSHVLARCPIALEQGRFKWRHDSILLQIFKIVREARNKGRAKFKLNQKKAHTQGRSKQVTVNGDTFHEFASERDMSNGELDSILEDQPLIMSTAEHPQDKSYKMVISKRTKPRKKKVLHVPAVKLPQGPFELSDDWQLQFDLPQQDGDAKQECNPNQPFPPHIASTGRRPDGVMWSDKLKMVMWIELTSPWEENMTTWYFEKHDKYSKIVDAAEGNGWKVVPLCVEVGARGYINDKWHHMTRALKLDKRMNKRLRDAVSNVAVRCSYFLYVCLRRREWCTSKLLG